MIPAIAIIAALILVIMLSKVNIYPFILIIIGALFLYLGTVAYIWKKLNLSKGNQTLFKYYIIFKSLNIISNINIHGDGGVVNRI